MDIEDSIRARQVKEMSTEELEALEDLFDGGLAEFGSLEESKCPQGSQPACQDQPG